MPIDVELTDALLVKAFHLGQSDKEIAAKYRVTVQAVSKRRMKLDLIRKPVARQVNEYLAKRWDIWARKEGSAHHNLHSAKALKVWLRWRLGDDKLSQQQIHLAQAWARGLQERGEVLCYNPDRPEGWYYRPRRPADGRRVIDWPAGLPFPDEKFKRALELPKEAATELAKESA